MTMNEKQPPPCEFCEGESGLEERLVTVYRRRGEQHFIFERVPAQVCKDCGHRYFSWETVEDMERLMDAPETQAHVKPVPVIALTDRIAAHDYTARQARLRQRIHADAVPSCPARTWFYPSA
jgi:YgiT-type zinc finger domain-containing protein